MMLETLERDTAVSRFAELHRPLSWDAPNEVEGMRVGALERFLELGFPTTEHEKWKHTSVAPISRTEFDLPGIADISLDGALIEQYKLSPVACELVFINGHYSEELSSDSLVAGVRIGSLERMLIRSPELVLEYLGMLIDPTHAFAALNTAFFEDGAIIHLAPGTIVEKPVHLLFVTTDGARPLMSSPRLLILAGAATQLTLIESHLSTGTGTHFTNAVTEVFAADNAIIDHYKIQRESDANFHVGVTSVLATKDASYESHVLTFGGGLTRNDLSVVLDGPGAGCNLDGLYLLEGKQHCDHHTLIDHKKPHTNSLELYKGILDGNARGIFDGTIIVRQDAQKITARQTNKNLVLSNDAIADSNPQLEIHADDVKCNHGSTIGQLDENAMFYLRSRGIGLQDARSILTYAFASELVDRVKVVTVRQRLQEYLLTRLPEVKSRRSNDLCP
jgi:Fe-S cluster assembly protein SufD